MTHTHSVADDATRLLALHEDPALLTVVNVWDPISATVVSDEPGTRALATASHSIAASFGYEDGEKIPLDLHLQAIERIVQATPHPVSADLEGGYGDAAETVRRAIGVGVVGANIEDQLKPLDEAAAQVAAIVKAGETEGIRFVLNARTDAFTIGGGRDPEVALADAVERGRAYLDAGAPVVFVPGKLDEHQVETLVEAFGPQKLTVIAVPGSLSLARLEQLGVARVSYGPWSQRVALTALQDLVRDVHAGGGLPEGTRPLN
ncbi:isocitrate lyase/phosphoenolpyruvate mutase family protein [uncultured Microbacterium sp.]|uniref:isocitrate lyase/PEP mutase family protein n=1 Tax=uncultured Microbacterium sp. TaxID=191216 RepID=UPI0025D51965|nr:isocitrate lyase/phosphoenolpyruvate mutase family protein [uncultured Microbacterium sp.]